MDSVSKRMEEPAWIVRNTFIDTAPRLSEFQRTQSYSPPSRRQNLWSRKLKGFQENAGSSEDMNAKDADGVLFEKCRFLELGGSHSGDLLDHVLKEPTHDQCRVVGETSALKKLFSLPLNAAGEAVCVHRVGRCLVVLDAPQDNDDVDDDDVDTGEVKGRREAVVTPMPPPRVHVAPEDEKIRVFPRILPAEPIEIECPPGLTEPLATGCEWQVRDGLSLVAVTSEKGNSLWRNSVDHRQADCSLFMLGGKKPCITGNQGTHDHLSALWCKTQALPQYHTQVTEDHVAVALLHVEDPVETTVLIDAWLSCCLQGSPSLLCFFVDGKGICRGCRFVKAVEIPGLADIVRLYGSDQRCLTAGEKHGELSSVVAEGAFDPGILRDMSRSLLEKLVDHCDSDGSQCLLLATPPGLQIMTENLEPLEEDAEGDGLAFCSIAAAPEQMLLDGFERTKIKSPPRSPSSGPASSPIGSDGGQLALESAWRPRALMLQALLFYHAAVRIAQLPRQTEAPNPGVAKGVPCGARWTAKSLREPLRVRCMLLRALRALQEADAAADIQSQRKKRFALLRASACEFLADSFLAQRQSEDPASTAESTRFRSALKYLKCCLSHLKHSNAGGDVVLESSVRNLEERVLAKRIDAHMCLARVRQRQPWSNVDGIQTSHKCIAAALKELDAAGELVRMDANGKPRTTLGAYESSLLASISKWQADLFNDLARICATAQDAEDPSELVVYLAAQHHENEGSEGSEPKPAELRERWLSVVISLNLRCLRELAGVPNEISDILTSQTRALLARAYDDLGKFFAETGRFTKAMTHAKQGIELFNATKDFLQAANLQLWLFRLQLRLAAPQTATSMRSADDEQRCEGLSVLNDGEGSACDTIILALRRMVQSLDSHGDAAECATRAEGNVLLGRLLFRKALTLFQGVAPFRLLSRLCDSEGALAHMLELLQNTEPPDSKLVNDAVKEATDLLQQASVAFEEASCLPLSGAVHTSLAAFYFRISQDQRSLRLSLVHCQKALQCLPHVEGGFGGFLRLRLFAQLLEAKCLIRGGGRGGLPHGAESRAAASLCEVALAVHQPPREPHKHLPSQSVPSPPVLGDGGPCGESPGSPVKSSDGGSLGNGTSLTGESSGGTPCDNATAGKESPCGAARKFQQQNPAPCLLQDSSLLVYLKQELNDLLLRLLKANDRNDSAWKEMKSELKGLYCALLTAWHQDLSQAAHALTALRDKMIRISNGEI